MHVIKITVIKIVKRKKLNVYSTKCVDGYNVAQANHFTALGIVHM